SPSLNPKLLFGLVLEFWDGKIYLCLRELYPATVKKYARRAQLGEILELDRATLKSDSVFPSNPRCWFTFKHTPFTFLFFFGHI
ncbi:hypothetical protein ERO13_D13G099025v2, partial [Gossypium hirsutum]